MAYNKITIAIVTITITFFGIVFFFLFDSGERDKSGNFLGLAAPELDSGSDVILGEEYTRYSNKKYGFSLEYPENLFPETFNEGEGAETVVFQSIYDEKDAEIATVEKQGFQVFITPIEIEIESGGGGGVEVAERNPVISRESILEDNPTAVVDEPVEVIIGDGIYALLFWGYDSAIGKTREVWFVYDNYLYEITTYEHLDTWLAKILSTWSFN